MGSVHGGDVSDLESCCSALSDMELPVTGTKGRRRQPRGASSREDEAISEVESCSSAVSPSRAGQASRRSTRRKTASKASGQASTGAEDVKADQMPETESCTPVVSETKRVTRSQRKTRTRSSAKQTEDSELSDADSCVSSVTGAETSKSTTRRATRSRRQTNPIPINLDESSERSGSPAPTARQTRSTRKKPLVSVEGSELPSCDSEGFESGPTYSITTRRRGKGPKPTDSDSDVTELHSAMGSHCSTRARGTPCSSRTGSWNSSRGSAVKDHYVVLENAGELSEEDRSLNDSRLEHTVIAVDADCTVLEEENQTLEEKEEEDVNSVDLTSKEVDAKMVDEDVVIIEPAVTVRDQQEEQSAENKDEDAPEMEVMQEGIQPAEPLKPCQSVTVTVCEEAPEITEEKGDTMEVVTDVDAPSSQEDKAEEEDAVMETQPSMEEKIEAPPLNADTQQVVDSSEVQVESIQVTSSQQHTITVDSEPEQQPKDIVVNKTKVISLLDSSDDDDDEFDEEEESNDDGEEVEEEERAGPSKKSGAAAAASVEGLFMIDTRPGEEADEDYYKESAAEKEGEAKSKEAAEEEEEDEFMDEEGDDDDDNETNLLFWSRNSHL